MKKAYVLRSSNVTVTSFVFDIFFDALIECKYETTNCFLVSEIPNDNKKNVVVVCDSTLSAFKLLIRGFKRVYVWVQGAWDHESFLNTGSKIKRTAIRLIERYVFKRTIHIFFVSKAMKKYYSKNYNMCFNSNTSIIPCFNTTIQLDSFNQKKYDDNIFVYAGGTAIWQGLEKIIKVYSFIEKHSNLNTTILLLVKDKDTCLNLLGKYEVSNYVINYVSVSELPKALSIAKFGFIIRDDNITNNVSTPTKLSTYLSCGVIPIYSSSIHDFAELASKMNFAIEYSENDLLDKINLFKNIKANDVMDEYIGIFNSYYSRTKYKELIMRVINENENH